MTKYYYSFFDVTMNKRRRFLFLVEKLSAVPIVDIRKAIEMGNLDLLNGKEIGG